MKQILKEIIKDALFFVATIFTYMMLLGLIFPDLEFNTRLETIKKTFQLIFTGEIFNYPRFFSIFIIFIGIPAVIIRRAANRLSNKLNFILMPIIIIIVFLLILPSIYLLIFKVEELLDSYIITSIVFQLVFSFIVAIWIMIKRKKQAIPV